jgi:hypothetical protein
MTPNPISKYKIDRVGIFSTGFYFSLIYLLLTVTACRGINGLMKRYERGFIDHRKTKKSFHTHLYPGLANFAGWVYSTGSSAFLTANGIVSKNMFAETLATGITASIIKT